MMISKAKKRIRELKADADKPSCLKTLKGHQDFRDGKSLAYMKCLEILEEELG